MKQKSAISPRVEEILSRCASDAEKIRIAKRLEAIAAEIWRQVFEPQAPSSLPRNVRRN